MSEVKFETRKDRGGNIGILCLSCRRVHWDQELPVIDALTGEPCGNCILIKDSSLLNDQNELHKTEVKNGEDCIHQPSQPTS